MSPGQGPGMPGMPGMPMGSSPVLMSPGTSGPRMPMSPGPMPPMNPGPMPGAPRLEVLEAKVDCITRAIFDLQAEIQGLLRVRKQVNAMGTPPMPGPPPGMEYGYMGPAGPPPPPPYAMHGAQ